VAETQTPKHERPGLQAPCRAPASLIPKERGKTANWLTLLVALLLTAVTFGIYWPVVHHQFINFDDLGYIIQNPHVRAGFSWANVEWAFTSGYGSNWHPLTWLSHMLDCQLYSLNAGKHHLTNLLFHTANTVLLFLLLKRVTHTLWRSAFVAALFALHPMHVESVAWVAERKDMLSTFFFLLTLGAYHAYANSQVQSSKSKVQNPKSKETIQSHHSSFWYCLALIFFALGLLSKPMLVTTPFVLLLLDFWPLCRFQPFEIKNLVFEKLPFFALATTSSVVTYLVQEHGGAVAAISVLPLSQRIPNALLSYVAYLQKLFWPVDLANYYPPREAIPLWSSGGALLLLLVISGLTLLVIRKHPYVAMGWFWFLGTLVPVIGIVQVGLQSMADRYTYIPYIGLFIAITWGIWSFFESQSEKIARHERTANAPVGRSKGLHSLSSIGLTLAAFAVIASSCILTALQVHLWKDSETLYRHTLAVTGQNPITQGNLGTALLEMRRFDEAIDHFAEAVRLKPDYAEALNNWAFALALQGKPDEAVPKYRASLALKPKNVRGHYTFGQALLLQGKHEEAIAEFTTALEVDPDFTPALNDLAWIRATNPDPKLRDGAQAVSLAEHACAISEFQNPMFIGTLAASYAEVGRFDDAVRMGEKARDLANASGQKALAERNEQLLQFYRARNPFHDFPPDKHEENSKP
jgi:Flp pilus assembly protein TadD